MEENLACKRCVRQHIWSTIHRFSSWFDQKLQEKLKPPTIIHPTIGLISCSPYPKKTPQARCGTTTPTNLRNIVGEQSSKLDVTIETRGLATYVTAKCAKRTRDLPAGHGIKIHISSKDNVMHGNTLAKYNINKQSILVAHQLGVSWRRMSRALATLGIQYMGQHAYQNCEKIVGKAIKTVAKKSTKEVLEEEIELSKQEGYGTYIKEEHGELPALAF